MTKTPVLLLVLFLASCTLEQGPDRAPSAVNGATAALAHTGPWVIPADVEAIADAQHVTMTEAGPWVGPSGCSGGFTEGGMQFGDYLLANFPQISDYGGYDCRAIVGIADQMSVHGTGRALDLFIPVDSSVSGDGNANNDLGDPVANWLISNAEYIGIQRVIWDRWIWESEPYSGEHSGAYNFPGSHPHNDHIHMELSVEASTLGTDFFSGPMDPPIPAGCSALPFEGGVIDNSSPCFQAFGNSAYWRVVEGDGIGGSYIWTNAFHAEEPSNWARWNVNLHDAGNYRVEIHLVAAHAIFDSTRYGVEHAGSSATITVDQSAADGWVSLGEYAFGAAGGQSVAVYDNSTGTVPSGQNVCVDAMRITNLGTPPTTDGGVPETDAGTPDGSTPTDDAGTSSPDAASGGDAGVVDVDAATPPYTREPAGCSVGAAESASPPTGFAAACVVLALLAWRRRAARH